MQLLRERSVQKTFLTLSTFMIHFRRIFTDNSPYSYEVHRKIVALKLKSSKRQKFSFFSTG